jgi:uncharacterized membrane-anchored protein
LALTATKNTAMKTKLLILVLALQTAWILGMSIRQELVLRGGQLILLETQPVDPRDLLRGDFVRLNYKISDVPREKFFAPPLTGEIPSGTTVFVAVVPTGTNEFYQVARASTEKFSPASNEVLLRGTAAQNWRNSVNSVHVEYGLEQYFVAEGTGNPHGKLTAQVAVAKSGRATIKEVFVDGKPYAEAMKGQ